jgi:hypothetical protein
MTLQQFADKYGIKTSTIRMRLKYGYSGQDLLKPVGTFHNMKK